MGPEEHRSARIAPDTSSGRLSHTRRGRLALLLAAAGALTLTAIPAVFTVDEPSYLTTLIALRSGRTTAPSTEGLPPSRALAYFDPVAQTRVVTTTPVAPTAPPLYAPIALPFSWAGWRGLVLLNALAFVLVCGLARSLASEVAGSLTAGRWALVAVAFGGYAIEYAQGVWPHGLSMGLTFSAFYLAQRAIGKDSLPPAAVAGLLAGLATGVRYPNIVFAAGLGASLLLLSHRRILLTAGFALGLAPPLLASSLFNQARLGSWNPISKGAGYLVPGSRDAGLVWDSLRMLWSRLVDFAARPEFRGAESMSWITRDAETGAWIVLGVVKKAWLQSAPWIALALGVALLFSLPRRSTAQTTRTARSALLVVAPMLLAFSAAGSSRHDGLCFNERYLLDLVPPMAVVFGVALSAARSSRLPILLGTATGLGLARLALEFPLGSAEHARLVLYLPLGLAASLILLGGVPYAAARRLLAPAAAAAVAWSLAIHLGSDLPASRALRGRNFARANTAAPLLPEGAAVVTWRGSKDFFGSLQLRRDLLVINAANDEIGTVASVADAVLARGTRLFLWLETMPAEKAQWLARGRDVREVARIGSRPLCVELRRPSELGPISPLSKPPAR